MDGSWPNDWLLYNAFPENVRKKISFCFRDNGLYVIYPAKDYQIDPDCGFRHCLTATNYRLAVALTDFIIPAKKQRNMTGN